MYAHALDIGGGGGGGGKTFIWLYRILTYDK